jgi:hypothetical protein
MFALMVSLSLPLHALRVIGTSFGDGLVNEFCSFSVLGFLAEIWLKTILRASSEISS